jgi:hypothetical protein
VGVRINFSGPPEMVVGAIKRLEFAIRSIKEGIKYSDIAGDKLRGEAPPELAAEAKLRDMLAGVLDKGDEGKAQVAG